MSKCRRVIVVVCRSKHLNQRNAELLNSGLISKVELPTEDLHTEDLHKDLHAPPTSPEITGTAEVKEEPQVPMVKEEEEQLPVFALESSYVKKEKSVLQQTKEDPHGKDISLELQVQAVTEGDTKHSSDNNEDWRDLFSLPDAQLEAEAPETSTKVNDDMSGIAEESVGGSAERLVERFVRGSAGGSKERKHQCSVCKRRFLTKDHLKLHSSFCHFAVKAEDRPYTCLICKKCFVTYSDLDAHNRIHTGEKDYRCSTCGKMFSYRNSLVSHTKTHTGERPFVCLVCEKAFVTSSDLYKHNRIHTGEKPYSCPTCEKTFTLKETLRHHMRTHTGERPYSCSICNKGFRGASALRRHRIVHSKEDPSSCSVCSKVYKRYSGLIAHMKLRHNITIHPEKRNVIEMGTVNIIVPRLITLNVIK